MQAHVAIVNILGIFHKLEKYQGNNLIELIKKNIELSPTQQIYCTGPNGSKLQSNMYVNDQKWF